MGEINSPLGRKTFESQSGRKFVVDQVEDSSGQPHADAGETPVQMPQKLTGEAAMEMRRRKIEELNRVSESARRRIEMLIGVGRATKNVSVATPNGSTVFSVRSLKGREIGHLAQTTAEMAKSNVITSMYQGRVLALGYAVYAVDGIDIDIVLDCVNEDDDRRLAIRMSFFEELDDAILNRLYAEWELMVKENNAQFAIKNEADAKEVSEDIKKSG